MIKFISKYILKNAMLISSFLTLTLEENGLNLSYVENIWWIYLGYLALITVLFKYEAISLKNVIRVGQDACNKTFWIEDCNIFLN